MVTTVVFPDSAVAQQCDDRISELRCELKISAWKEFHFNKDNDRFREAFLKCVSQYSFWYSSVVLNKDALAGPGFQFKDSLYKYTVNLAFQNLFSHLDQATIVFDRCGGREFTSQLRTYLRHKMNEKAGNRNHGKIKKVKDASSAGNNLLQMADMICGAVARCYSSDKPGRAQFRNIVRAKERHVNFWPAYKKSP